jgi:hypothetical protein
MPPQVPSYRAFDAVAVTGVASFYSGSTKLGAFNLPGNAVGTAVPTGKTLSFVGSFTGTAAGSLTVEVSNASDNDIRLGLDVWVTYDQVAGAGFTAGVATVVAGQISGSANFAVSMTRLAFGRVRLKYANTGGTGTITALACVKAI